MKHSFIVEVIVVLALFAMMLFISLRAEAQGYGRPGNYTVMPPVYGGNGFAHQTIYGPDGSYNITHFPGTHNYGYQSGCCYNRPFAEGYQMGQDIRTIFRGLTGGNQ